MKQKLSDSKADSILQDERVFLSGKSSNYEYYTVIGSSKKVYSVVLNKNTNEYSCDCLNIRFIPCSHIKAVVAYKEEVDYGVDKPVP